MEKNEELEPVATREFEGVTLEAAIKAALKELRLPKNQIQIQVISEGKRGLFGLSGAKTARIRVTILPKKQN